MCGRDHSLSITKLIQENMCTEVTKYGTDTFFQGPCWWSDIRCIVPFTNLQGRTACHQYQLLTSLHVWLTFGTDRELQNTEETGNFPPEKM